MKKTLAAAITSALVIGAASTTFAAANPFSDVPADHWSYDAVAELAQDGIIDGYGDGTFRGDRAITRYEMAQMIARAMAKDVNGDAKATLDKLAAEYADELNNLGVRVDALEKKVDNTKFSGELRLRYDEKEYDGQDKKKSYPALFRLETVSQVNDSWKVKTRSEAQYNLDGNDSGNDDHFVLQRAYAEGPLFGSTAKFGKFYWAGANGIMFDHSVTGAAFKWGGSSTDVTLTAGVLDNKGSLQDHETEMVTLEVDHDFSDKFGMNVGYYEFRNNEFFHDDKNAVWSVGAKYAFNKNLALDATYAKSDLDNDTLGKGTNTFTAPDDDAYVVNLQYKGAKKADKGSFGVNLGYYDLSAKVAFDPTFGATESGTKGWRIGTNYTVAENILWSAWYYDGESTGNKSAVDGTDFKKFRTQVEFFF